MVLAVAGALLAAFAVMATGCSASLPCKAPRAVA
jgi:hypothetical protein